MTQRIFYSLAAALLLAAPSASAGPAQDAVLGHFAEQGTASFSAERGEALFRTPHGGGKPDTPACTTCHSDSPLGAGATRAGKPIDPMALSRTPNRYADLEKVEKWFGRNCRSVLGRECSPQEKGDFLTFMISQ